MSTSRSCGTLTVCSSAMTLGVCWCAAYSVEISWDSGEGVLLELCLKLAR